MGQSEILLIDELAPDQTNAFQSVNDAVVAMSAASNEALVVDMSGGNVAVPILDMVRYGVFRLSGQTAPREIAFPHRITFGDPDVDPVPTRRVFGLRNEGAYAITVKTQDVITPGTIVLVPPATALFIVIDGSDALAQSGATGIFVNNHSVGGYIFGLPGASDVVLAYSFVEPVIYPINFEGSGGNIRVNPTATTHETGSIAFSSVADTNDTVSISDGQSEVIFTFAASGDGNLGHLVQVARGSTATNSAQNLATAINNNTLIDVTSAGGGTTLTITNNTALHGSITKSDVDNDYVVTNFSGLDMFEMIVNKNGSPVGTIGIDGSGDFWFATAGRATVTFDLGDLLTVTAPASPDATAEGINWTLLGAKT